MTSPIETNNVVERLRTAAKDANEMVRFVAKTAAAKGVDVQAITGHPAEEVERIGAFEHSAAIFEAADLIQSLSDRIDVLAKLAGDVRWKELAEGSPFTVIDRMMLRDLHAAGQASLTQGGKNV